MKRYQVIPMITVAVVGFAVVALFVCATRFYARDFPNGVESPDFPPLFAPWAPEGAVSVHLLVRPHRPAMQLSGVCSEESFRETCRAAGEKLFECEHETNSTIYVHPNPHCLTGQMRITNGLYSYVMRPTVFACYDRERNTFHIYSHSFRSPAEQLIWERNRKQGDPD